METQRLIENSMCMVGLADPVDKLHCRLAGSSVVTLYWSPPGVVIYRLFLWASFWLETWVLTASCIMNLCSVARITQAFLGTSFLPFLRLSEMLQGKLNCFLHLLWVFLYLVNAWPFHSSLLIYTWFRKCEFIFVSSKIDFLFVLCSFLGYFQVNKESKGILFAILFS